MLLGIGIALTMSPMTSAAMNAVAVEKAGIASGVLSMFRMVGGSLGVAVTGAIFQGLIGPPRQQLSGAACPRRARGPRPPARRRAYGRLRGCARPGQAGGRRGQEAFVDALGHAMTVSAAVALAGAAVGARRSEPEAGVSVEVAEATVSPVARAGGAGGGRHESSRLASGVSARYGSSAGAELGEPDGSVRSRRSVSTAPCDSAIVSPARSGPGREDDARPPRGRPRAPPRSSAACG